MTQFPLLETDGTQQQRVDRCQSCHIGLDNPAMTAEKIIKTVDKIRSCRRPKSPTYLEAHPATRETRGDARRAPRHRH